MPRVQLGLSVLPTYTPYSSPWSTYAGYGPPAASPHGFGAGGSSWSPGLTIDLQRATLDRSPEFPSSTSGRFNATCKSRQSGLGPPAHLVFIYRRSAHG